MHRNWFQKISGNSSSKQPQLNLLSVSDDGVLSVAIDGKRYDFRVPNPRQIWYKLKTQYRHNPGKAINLLKRINIPPAVPPQVSQNIPDSLFDY